MDKGARAIQDAYDITYMGALDIKKKVQASPGFDQKRLDAVLEGKSYIDLLVELAKPIVDLEYYPEP